MTKVGLTLLNTGFVYGLDALVVRGEPWKWAKLPCLTALIQHPDAGWGLFDTGYSPRFFDATRAMPYRIYRWLTPVEISYQGSQLAQLAHYGLTTDDIRWIFLSHLHGDHCCGVRDFPQASILVSRQAISEILPLRGLAALRAAYLPELLDERLSGLGLQDPTSGSEILASQGGAGRLQNQDPARHTGSRGTAPGFKLYPLDCPIFGYNVDLFGDGSCLAIPLPGHAAGQMGLLVHSDAGPTLLAADAAWDYRAIEQDRDVHPLIHRLITHDPSAAKETLGRLQEFHKKNPDTELVYSHCRYSLRRNGGTV
jgi:glyoxylase-like metal-dependent hydrolase (beta-lactamase superfamily II)